MLPRKLHLEQINRFHDKVEELSKSIHNETDKDKKIKMCIDYYDLTTKVWCEIDDFIEDIVKEKIDKLDREYNER